MNRPIETYEGRYFFRRDAQVYVNRNTESFDAPYHNHDFLEIVYIVQGEGFHHIGDTVKKVRKGDICYIPIGISHVFRPTSKNSQPLIVSNCLFLPGLLPRFSSFAAEKAIIAFLGQMENGSLPYYEAHDRNDRYDRLFAAMYEQYSAPQPGSGDLLHALLFQLIIELYRSMNRTAQGGALPREAAFEDLLHYLELHCEQELTLTHMSRISGFSERHLQRLFHQHTGQSWFKYLQTIRVRRSTELLLGTSDKIQSIAEAVGYKDIHSFNTVFKRLTGRTPKQYRNQG